MQPFIQDQWAFSTDGHTLITFDKSLIDTIDFESHPKAPNALAVIPENNCDISLKVSALKKAVKQSKADYDKKYKKETIRCGDCNGRGEVDFVFHSTVTHQRHEVENDCPTCEGSGKMEVITDLEVDDYIYDPIFECITFKTAVIQRMFIDRLIEVAELIGEDSVQITHISESQYGKVMFRVGRAKILIMGVRETAFTGDPVILKTKAV